jgi:hypothetical protein
VQIIFRIKEMYKRIIQGQRLVREWHEQTTTTTKKTLSIDKYM